MFSSLVAIKNLRGFKVLELMRTYDVYTLSSLILTENYTSLAINGISKSMANYIFDKANKVAKYLAEKPRYEEKEVQVKENPTTNNSETTDNAD
ncbi:UNVERIFIED_CONTAM: hypothetical protein O8I53_13670 [Campylobacter lari]